MTRGQLVVGVDPGPTPGVVTLLCQAGRVVQVTTYTTPYDALREAASYPDPWVAVERFIVGRGTARKTRGASMDTIAQAQDVAAAVRAAGYPLQFLPAGAVKPIIPDARLRAYGVWQYLTGPHQRDAARHAVYMGLKHGALDPVI